MIDFQKIEPGMREQYLPYLIHADRGCGYSFANLYMWGRQRCAIVSGRMVLFSHFSGHSVYPFPVGEGDVKPALDAVIHDAQARGIPCRVTGMSREDTALLETLYPGRFHFHCDRDGFDYVYDINDLADLKGRKFQQKRNHINRFHQSFPDTEVRPLDERTMAECRALVKRWFQNRLEEDPQSDLYLEEAAMRRAFCCYRELGMVGLVLYAGDRAVAMTMGSFLSEDTLDVHFEKADEAFPGAYAVINRAFARYIRENYPRIRYLNREDDTGSPGLRKAKLSYSPHHLVEKYWAHLVVEEYDD